MKHWQIPENYYQVDSAVEGITVFAPKQENDSEVNEPISYKCPQCGATTKFDVSAGGVACEHCGYIAKANSLRVGKKADQFEFKLETLSHARQKWGPDRKKLHCENCGAVLSIPAKSIAVTCPFCASNQVNVSEPPSDELRPKFLIPFKIQAKNVQKISSEWLGKGWFHPKALAQRSHVNNFNGVYLPYWTFGAEIGSDWKAEVGYERQERYYDHGSKEWKTRTKIVWRWESGRVLLNIDDLLVSGSTKVSHVILKRIANFNLAELQEFSSDFLAGWQAQNYDIDLPTAWDEGKSLMREQAKTKCYQDIPSSHVRNFSMVADFSDETWRYILLPIYISAYIFENETFQIMVNGQNGVIAGQKPVEWWKVWLAIAALLLPGVGLGMIGLPLLLAGGIGLFPIILGAILFVGGAIFSINIYKKAAASEAG